MTNNPQYYHHDPDVVVIDEDEINLIDYLRVLWRWKWLIGGVTFIITVAAIFYSFMLPKVYEISMILEPGIISIDKNGNYVYLDSPQTIGDKIGSGTYNRRIVREHEWEPKETVLEFRSDIDKRGKSNLVKVRSEWGEERIDDGKKAMASLVMFVAKDYVPIINKYEAEYDIDIAQNQNKINDIAIQKKNIVEEIAVQKNRVKKLAADQEDIDKQILIADKTIEKLAADIALHEKNQLAIERRIAELSEDVLAGKENTREIMEQRNNALKNQAGDTVSMLLYATTIQQSLAYADQLNREIFDLAMSKTAEEQTIEALKNQRDTARLEIERLRLERDEKIGSMIEDTQSQIRKLEIEKDESLEAKITAIENEIKKMQFDKEMISNVKIVQEPEASVYPVKPQKKKIVVLTFVASLFLMIFASFFIDYVVKAVRAEKEEGSVQA